MAQIAIILLVLTVLAQGILAMDTTTAVNYYLSPDGSDQNSGALNSPWLSLEHALGKVSPGDALNLRGGTYYENRITIDVSGTASAPITIQSYPGEQAVIDGGTPIFMTAPNTEWELVDGDIDLYRSLRTFSEEDDFVRAWLVDDDVQLLEYESAKNLESTNYGPLNGLDPIYVGPGLQLHRDGHIYIRLVYNPNDLTDVAGNPIAPTPIDINPNHNRLAVFFSRNIFLLDGASHLRIKDLGFAHANYIMDVRNGSNYVMLSGCRMDYGNRGIVIRGDIHDWEISDCEFSNGTPDYIYWTDVKNKGIDVTEAHPEFQSVAISGAMTGFNIHHNLFRNTFDGLTLDQDSSDTLIMDNVFKDVRDDSINLSKGIGNVEVGRNLFWHVKSGISNLSSDATPGHVYIHHNIIDNSAYQRGGRPGNSREDNWPAWNIGNPFPDHDNGDRASWWKLYNNTIVTRQDPGHLWSAAGPDSVTGNSEKYVLNNIFYALDERVIFRDDLASSGSHYDGDVFHRNGTASLPLFSNFGDGDRYDSLSDFLAESGTDWEHRGLELDPGFDPSELNDPTFDPVMICERYRPTSGQMFTPGASYDGLDWPGTQNVTYRGALGAVLDMLSRDTLEKPVLQIDSGSQAKSRFLRLPTVNLSNTDAVSFLPIVGLATPVAGVYGSCIGKER